ncbi:MAG: hypothetical protein OXC25_06165 [Thiotrichales bacterium]|nr:hypothetical protein [Thiotrichales bacterium]MCY4349411.1 hypothetical protein [Thiotrichales bacterium]
MSIAVAVRKDARIVLATDSQTNLGSERVPAENLSGPKFMQIGEAYMAATGWTLYSNILADVLGRRRAAPRLHDEASIFKFFMRLWGELHERYNFVKDQADDADSPFGSLDSTFLVTCASGIFGVASDLSVLRYERYFAIGSGAPIAIGAVHALYESEHDAESIARSAAGAAIDHDVYCGHPIHLATVREKATRARRKSG